MTTKYSPKPQNIQNKQHVQTGRQYKSMHFLHDKKYIFIFQ